MLAASGLTVCKQRFDNDLDASKRFANDDGYEFIATPVTEAPTSSRKGSDNLN